MPGSTDSKTVGEIARDIRHEINTAIDNEIMDNGLPISDGTQQWLMKAIEPILLRHIAPLVEAPAPERFGIEAAIRAIKEGKMVRPVGGWPDGYFAQPTAFTKYDRKDWVMTWENEMPFVRPVTYGPGQAVGGGTYITLGLESMGFEWEVVPDE